MRKTAKETAREISNFVNGARPGEIKELAELMANDHPTLQQNTMGLVANFINNMAERGFQENGYRFC